MFTLVGLGPGPVDQLTQGAYRLLETSPQVVIQDLNHPVAPWLTTQGVSVHAWPAQDFLIPGVYGVTGDGAAQSLIWQAQGVVHTLIPGLPDLGAAQSTLKFLDTVARLRRECPWDREQTPQSLCPYILEEAAELVEALEAGSEDQVLDELGDVLLQVVLQATIYQERGGFDFAQVCDQINAKMIRRHPHVFGAVPVASSRDVIQNWEQIKNQETPQSLSNKLQKLLSQGSSLAIAHKISHKVAKVGFEWPDFAGVWAKLQEELRELEQAMATESLGRQSEELGDVLFSLINVARWLKIDSDTALRATNRRFLARFALVEQGATRPLNEYSPGELEILWQKAKQQLH